MSARNPRGWAHLFAGNPMLVEVSRFRRKYLSLRGTGLVTTVFFGALYGMLLMMVIRYADSVDPIVVLQAELGLSCFLAPAVLYASIAGEREKRTWDFLLVAPVSRAQIVVGKFLAAAQGIVAMALLFLLPLGVTLLGSTARHQRGQWSPYGPSGSAQVGLYDPLLASVVIASFALMLCAVTLFFSARCRRALMALGASLGTVVLFFAVFPLLTMPLADDSFEWRLWIELLNLFNPFVAVGAIMDPYERDSMAIPASLFGWPQVVFYLVATAAFLIWTIRTVHWPDNEVKFIGGTRARS